MKHFIARLTIVLFSLVLSSAAQVNGSGTPGVIPIWTGSAIPTETLGNSEIFETGGGNVGIRTTSPGATLSVVGQNGSNARFGANARPALDVEGGRGGALPAGDLGTAGTGGIIGLVAGSGGPACFALGGAGGAILLTGGKGASAVFGGLRCAGVPGAPGSVILAANGGNVGIGEMGPAHALEVKVGGTTLADEWTVRSSLRFKTNIQPLLGALEKVEQLRGVSYNRKDDGRREIGVVAEEVDKVVPEVVSHDPETNDVQGVDYSRLAALLIEAVKMQQAEIQQLKARLEELTTKPRN